MPGVLIRIRALLWRDALHGSDVGSLQVSNKFKSTVVHMPYIWFLTNLSTMKYQNQVRCDFSSRLGKQWVMWLSIEMKYWIRFWGEIYAVTSGYLQGDYWIATLNYWDSDVLALCFFNQLKMFPLTSAADIWPYGGINHVYKQPMNEPVCFIRATHQCWRRRQTTWWSLFLFEL